MLDFVIGFIDGVTPVLMGAGAYFMSYAFSDSERFRLLVGVLTCLACLIFM